MYGLNLQFRHTMGASWIFKKMYADVQVVLNKDCFKLNLACIWHRA